MSAVEALGCRARLLYHDLRELQTSKPTSGTSKGYSAGTVASLLRSGAVHASL